MSTALSGESPAHPSPPGPVAPPAGCRETHIGVVFLVGDRAYKLKKPVRTGFLDFTTRSARLAACQREVRLNRRLAPDVYLGVADVTDPLSAKPADHLVVMRRMPEHRRLSTLIARGEPVGESLRQLAHQLAAFHASAARGEAITREGTGTALARRWAANLERTGRARTGGSTGSDITEAGRLAQRFLAGRTTLFESRCAAGRVIDGHGDLIADDVFCLDDGPRALDCLEFDDTLRFVDGLDDAAFLAMDLERLGRPDLAHRFFTDYAEFAADPAPSSLRHHFVAYRAWVRALVNTVRAEQGEPAAAQLATEYAQLGLRHLRHGAVRLVLVGGLPASGKSTLAAGLADATGAVLLSSDRIRKELAGIDPRTSAKADYQQGLYSPLFTERVYDELLSRARRALEAGEHVVADASWIDANNRRWASELADQAVADLVALHCEAPTAERLRRLHSRGSTLSDATEGISAAMAQVASPWPEATTISTLRTPQECLDEALRAWETVLDHAG